MSHTPDNDAAEPGQGRDWFLLLATFIVCTAVSLGVYFVRLNLEVDREREALTERLVRCREAGRAALGEQPGASLRNDCSSIEAEFTSRFGYAR
ncbi:hypothetical protein [Pseudomonas vanderleydeniana]|uniref:Uncharacterized protein n=1 Tax=Pseudomonas vanderleydeniana TaxID=2745495 RepID=A0A9E6PHL7_9PSED|nr:hypothetical protein [Pseudomonas vanderleydeniana]QXI26689.1 hypothetical protein HU752_022540 [Pseudomonas vanderleydeniana]